MIFDSQNDSQIDFLFFSANYNIQTVLNDRGVSDVGFPIFADADTDADFAF